MSVRELETPEVPGQPRSPGRMTVNGALITTARPWPYGEQTLTEIGINGTWFLVVQSYEEIAEWMRESVS